MLGRVHIRRSSTVERPRGELCSGWRNLAPLPRFMPRLHSVTVGRSGRSHWIVKSPAGSTLEWDAQIVRDEPGHLLAWRTLGDSDLQHKGRLVFEDAPGHRGTVVTVDLRYDPPAGRVGVLIASLMGGG